MLTSQEESLLKGLDNRLVKEGFSPKVLPVNVPRKSIREVVEGGNQLYFADDNCKQVFDRLVESLNLPLPAEAIRGSYENSGVSVSA